MAFVSFVAFVFVNLLNHGTHGRNEINKFIVSLASALRNSYETGCLTHQKFLYVSCSYIFMNHGTYERNEKSKLTVIDLIMNFEL